MLFSLMGHMTRENENTNTDGTKLEQAVQNLRQLCNSKKIITVILKDSNIDYFENVMVALDDVLSTENVFIMIVEPVPIESSSKKEIIEKIELLKKKHGQDSVYHTTPKTELEYKSLLAVGDLGIFIEEYSVCFKEMLDFACLNKSAILIEQSSSAPIRATKVNFNSKDEVVGTICKCLAKENPYYEQNKQIILGLQSVDFISEILSQEKSNTNKKIPEYLTDEKIDFIIKSFKEAQTRAIILDYDGTLTEIVSKPGMAFPKKDLKTLIKNLGEIPNSELILCTGRTKQHMDEWFPYYKTDVILTTKADQTVFEINMVIYAEHTAAKRIKNEWFRRKLDLSFLPRAHDIMKKTLETLPGSNIEVKDTGLVFHYRGCDQEYIDQSIDHMRTSLIRSIGKTANIKSGKSIIEVTSTNISKDYCIKQYIDRKFILCAGDDVTDEDMFKMNCCSILVGNKPSYAKYRVDTPDDLKKVLVKIHSVVGGNTNK